MDTLWEKKKKYTSCFQRTKEAFREKSRNGRKGGKSKGADEIFSASCQKAAADKRSGTAAQKMEKQLERREAEQGDALQVQAPL